MDKEKLIGEMLLLPMTAIEYHMSKHLADLFPDKALIEGEIGCFDVEGYAAAQHCVLSRKARFNVSSDQCDNFEQSER